MRPDRRCSAGYAAGALRAALVAATLATAAVCSPAGAQLPAWRAQHPQLPGTLLLLGSIHLLSAADHPLPGTVDSIYEQADTVIFEIDLDDIEPTEIQTRLMAAAMLDGGATLADVVSPQLYRQTAQVAEELGMDVQLFARFEPWFVATMLLSVGLGQQGYQPQFGIEQYLLGKSLRDGKEVLGVESLQTQVGVFDLLSRHDQSAFLEQTLTELRRDDTSMQHMVAAWRNGELDDLQDELIGEFEQFPGLYERLVVGRNTAWTAALEDLARRDEVFAVVVGALHLVGSDSVVAQLRRRGYTISAIQ